MTSSPPIPLIVADGDIPTTRLVARELGAVFPRIEVRIPATLFGTDFAGRPIVVSRLCHPSLSWLPEYLAQRGLRYAYLLDDNFWEITPDVDVHLAPFFKHPAVLATLERFIRGAAVVVVWSQRMLQYVTARFPTVKVELLPTGVDLAQLDSMRPPPESTHDGIIRIGYPTSRRPGVATLLAGVVAGLGARYGDRVQFEFAGWMPESLEGLTNVTLVPQMTEYEQYLHWVLSRQWDIGMAPLVEGVFESFKTDVKYREYAAFGVPGVYSRVSPYTETVTDGRTGLLVENEVQAWIEALVSLIENPGSRDHIAATALADVHAHRNLQQTGARFAELLSRAAAEPA